jgi:hypothetical protein
MDRRGAKRHSGGRCRAMNDISAADAIHPRCSLPRGDWTTHRTGASSDSGRGVFSLTTGLSVPKLGVLDVRFRGKMGE